MISFYPEGLQITNFHLPTKMKKEKNMIQKGIYQHYKENYYEVIDLAKHSETLENMVIYRALYGNFEL
jgi:hypothetical protein